MNFGGSWKYLHHTIGSMKKNFSNFGHLSRLSYHGRKHLHTIFTIEILIKILVASICMIDLFCKDMAASNLRDERTSALIPIGCFNSWGQSVFSKGKLKIMGKVSEVEPFRNTVKNFVEVTCT